MAISTEADRRGHIAVGNHLEAVEELLAQNRFFIGAVVFILVIPDIHMAAILHRPEVRSFIEALIGDVGIHFDTGKIVRSFGEGLFRHEVELQAGRSHRDRIAAGKLINRFPTSPVGFFAAGIQRGLNLVHIEGDSLIGSRVFPEMHQSEHSDRRNLCPLHTADKQTPIIDGAHVGIVDTAKGTRSGSGNRGFVHQTDILNGIIRFVGTVPANQRHNIRVLREVMVDNIIGRRCTGQLLLGNCQRFFCAEAVFIRVSGLTQVHTDHLNLADILVDMVIFAQQFTLVIAVKVRVFGIIFIHAVQVHRFTFSVEMPQGNIAFRSQIHILGNCKLRFDGITHSRIMRYIQSRPVIALIGIDIRTGHILHIGKLPRLTFQLIVGLHIIHPLVRFVDLRAVTVHHRIDHIPGNCRSVMCRRFACLNFLDDPNDQ